MVREDVREIRPYGAASAGGASKVNNRGSSSSSGTNGKKEGAAKRFADAVQSAVADSKKEKEIRGNHFNAAGADQNSGALDTVHHHVYHGDSPYRVRMRVQVS